MKHGVKVALLGVLLVLMNVGNLFANAESPKTDFFGAMFNLNLVYPNVFMEENTDDDVEDLYGVFVSLFSGRLNIDKHYHGVALSGLGAVDRGTGVQGGLCYWGREGTGVSFGLLSTGFIDMKGVQIGGVTGAALAVCRPFVYLTDLEGVQIGGINLASESWGQCGIWNYVEDEACVQIGIRNICDEEGGGVQIGLWNSFEEKAGWLSHHTVQLGLINTLSSGHPRGNTATVQVGLLNRTRSGWWLPFSNFGL